MVSRESERARVRKSGLHDSCMRCRSSRVHQTLASTTQTHSLTRPLHLSAVVMIHASFIHVYLFAVYRSHFPAMHRARTSRMHALTSAYVDGLSPSGSLRLSRVASRTKAASRCTFLSPSP